MGKAHRAPQYYSPDPFLVEGTRLLNADWRRWDGDRIDLGIWWARETGWWMEDSNSHRIADGLTVCPMPLIIRSDLGWKSFAENLWQSDENT